MWLSLIYTFSEVSLILGVLRLFVLHLSKEDSPKKYAQTARFWLLLSLFFSILFYDKSCNEAYFINNAYTLVFKLSIGLMSYMMLGLSSAWFVAEKRTGCRYYVLMLLALASINLLLSSVRLPSLFLSYVLLIYINYRLLDISYERLPSTIAPRYIRVSLLIILMFAAGFSFLSFKLGANVSFTAIKDFLSSGTQEAYRFFAAVALCIPFLYSLGLAPFHVLAEEKAGKAILPVSHYFAVITPLAFWGAFFKLNNTIFIAFFASFAPVYVAFALISVLFGAVGANARINLHRILAYAALYHFGLILLLLSFFKPEADFAAFIVLLAYIISINGAYIVFYGLKSRGEYLSAITSLSGLSETRPELTAALLISLFSLLGLPPFVGFLGQLTLVNELIKNESYASLGVALFCLLFLAKSCLEIIKTAYFEHKIKNYDTPNRQVIFLSLLNALIIAIAAFNPGNIMAILKDMFYVVYL